MMNHVTLIGYVGGDAQMREVGDGMVANFSVATNRRWRDRSGQRQEETEWHRIVCWGKLAEIAGQYVVKGKLVAVQGRLQTRKWMDKSGVEKYTTEVVCLQLELLGNRDGGVGGARPPERDGNGAVRVPRRRAASPPKRPDRAFRKPESDAEKIDEDDDGTIPF